MNHFFGQVYGWMSGLVLCQINISPTRDCSGNIVTFYISHFEVLPALCCTISTILKYSSHNIRQYSGTSWNLWLSLPWSSLFSWFKIIRQSKSNYLNYIANKSNKIYYGIILQASARLLLALLPQWECSSNPAVRWRSRWDSRRQKKLSKWAFIMLVPFSSNLALLWSVGRN